jgi:hypothetical protein
LKDIFENLDLLVLKRSGTTKIPVHLEIMSQELYDTDIKKFEFVGDDSAYRYFEELYYINIPIVDKNMEIVLPRHKVYPAVIQKSPIPHLPIEFHTN